MQRRACALVGVTAFILAWGMSNVAEAQLGAAQITTYGERSANAPKELGAFAFLVGKWEGGGKAKTTDGKIVEFGGVTWIGRYVLDGTAIADEIHASNPDGSPSLGISLRQYDAAKKAWIVEFLNVSNSFLRRQVNARSGAVKVDGKTVVVIGEAPDTWGRETYRVESHDAFTYTLDLSNDGGRTWNVGQVEMSFSRKE